MEGIQIQGLTKVYKDIVAVDHLTLSIPKGELFSLLGVNGAGKTTTIKMLSCLTEPTEGTACLNGNSITRDPSAVKSIIALSPQETAVAPGLSVYENLVLMWGLYGFPKAGREEKITQLVSSLGLESVIKKKAGNLSGGYHRRLSIAMALISEPQVIFLDEPTTYLDISNQISIMKIIAGLAKSGKGIVTVMHDLPLAFSFSDIIVMLENGRIADCDTPKNLYKKNVIKRVFDTELKFSEQENYFYYLYR